MKYLFNKLTNFILKIVNIKKKRQKVMSEVFPIQSDKDWDQYNDNVSF